MQGEFTAALCGALLSWILYMRSVCTASKIRGREIDLTKKNFPEAPVVAYEISGW